MGTRKEARTRHQVHLLKRDLKRREADAKESRDDSERQINLYNKLWTTHGNLLMEAQVLRSQVMILSFDR